MAVTKGNGFSFGAQPACPFSVSIARSIPGASRIPRRGFASGNPCVPRAGTRLQSETLCPNAPLQLANSRPRR